MVTLNTSDYISITSAVVQVGAAVGIAVWQVRKTNPRPPQKAAVRRSEVHDLLLIWFKASWLFMVFSVVGVAALINMLTNDAPFNKQWVGYFVLACFNIVCNVTGVVVSLFAIAQQRINVGMLAIAERLADPPQKELVPALQPDLDT